MHCSRWQSVSREDIDACLELRTLIASNGMTSCIDIQSIHRGTLPLHDFSHLKPIHKQAPIMPDVTTFSTLAPYHIIAYIPLPQPKIHLADPPPAMARS